MAGLIFGWDVDSVSPHNALDVLIPIGVKHPKSARVRADLSGSAIVQPGKGFSNVDCVFHDISVGLACLVGGAYRFGED